MFKRIENVESVFGVHTTPETETKSVWKRSLDHLKKSVRETKKSQKGETQEKHGAGSDSSSFLSRALCLFTPLFRFRLISGSSTMAVDQDNVSRILSVLAHPLRREILMLLNDKEECSFSDLMNALKVDTGKLSFHIRSLASFLEQTPTNKYKLSKIGENAIVMIKDLEAWAAETELTKKESVLPLADFAKRFYAFLIDLGIGIALFFALPNALAITTTQRLFFDVNFILFLLLLWMYFSLLEGFAGQTIGKRIMGLKVVRTDGKRMFYDHAAVRNFGKIFLLPVDLIVGRRLKDKRYMRYFDKFSGTTVVDLRLQDRSGSVSNGNGNSLD